MEAIQPLSVELRYCLYARKSSESDERQAMSIDSQLKEMTDLAKREGLNVVETKQESYSAKETGKRPVFNELVSGLRSGEFNALLVWDPSRCSRNAGDLGALIDLMDQQKLLQVRTFSQTFTNNPNEKFLLMILCSQAKLENDNRGINVKRGIRAKCEMGWRPGVAPLGYMNRAFAGVKDIIVDPDRAPVITEVFNRAAQGWSGRKLKGWLDESGFTNRSGCGVTLSQVFLILNNPFYYGEFEYPVGSGKTYKGSHKALVTKELFQQVQDNRSLPNKAAWGSKHFAFKGIFKCAGCGSEITAEEKFKPLLDGSFNRHVYYHCTRQVNYDCPERYINEKALIAKLIDYIKEHSKEITVTPELGKQARRHGEVVKRSLGLRGVKDAEIDPIAEYAEFILREGTYKEQGQLIQGIQTTFAIRDREIRPLPQGVLEAV
jgi:site-specific DNA recombinase